MSGYLEIILSQMMLGLVNGSFYALIALGLAIIVSMLGIINFAQGAFYMMGAFLAWMLNEYLGMGYWAALLAVPAAMLTPDAALFAAGYGGSLRCARQIASDGMATAAIAEGDGL